MRLHDAPEGARAFRGICSDQGGGSEVGGGIGVVALAKRSMSPRPAFGQAKPDPHEMLRVYRRFLQEGNVGLVHRDCGRVPNRAKGIQRGGIDLYRDEVFGVWADLGLGEVCGGGACPVMTLRL